MSHTPFGILLTGLIASIVRYAGLVLVYGAVYDKLNLPQPTVGGLVAVFILLEAMIPSSSNEVTEATLDFWIKDAFVSFSASFVVFLLTKLWAGA